MQMENDQLILLSEHYIKTAVFRSIKNKDKICYKEIWLNKKRNFVLLILVNFPEYLRDRTSLRWANVEYIILSIDTIKYFKTLRI